VVHVALDCSFREETTPWIDIITTRRSNSTYSRRGRQFTRIFNMEPYQRDSCPGPPGPLVVIKLLDAEDESSMTYNLSPSTFALQAVLLNGLFSSLVWPHYTISKD
jgi:hypothetical protein